MATEQSKKSEDQKSLPIRAYESIEQKLSSGKEKIKGTFEGVKESVGMSAGKKNKTEDTLEDVKDSSEDTLPSGKVLVKEMYDDEKKSADDKLLVVIVTNQPVNVHVH